MKLDDYIMLEQLAAKDWRGAVSTIAAYYGLQLPAHFEPEIILGDVEIPQVNAYLDNNCYHWSHTKGFLKWTRSRDYNTFKEIGIVITIPVVMSDNSHEAL